MIEADCVALDSATNVQRGPGLPDFTVVDRSALTPLWAFVPSRPRWTVSAIRAHALATGLKRRPARLELIPAPLAEQWTCLFLHLPDGRLTDAHRFTLARLRNLPRHLMAVCATPSPSMVPAELSEQADALLWKDMPGFDFSAYAYGLEILAQRSPGADVLVMNDSVFGPFCDVEPLLAATPWRFTGFTGFSMIENHIQSYAFHIRAVTPDVVRALRPVMPKRVVFDTYRDVVYCQETRLARVASRSMSVGALWFADMAKSGDPSLVASLDLLAEGFPFLKKSLFSRNAGIYQRKLLDDALAQRDHPAAISGG